MPTALGPVPSFYPHFYQGGNQELSERKPRLTPHSRRQNGTGERGGLSLQTGLRTEPPPLASGTQRLERASGPHHAVALRHQHLALPGTAAVTLLLWSQSYIFNDLQNLPVRREGRVEIRAKQFALRIKLSSLLLSKNMQK